jgi:peptide-methionine (S)-S-oxide reductase
MKFLPKALAFLSLVLLIFSCQKKDLAKDQNLKPAHNKAIAVFAEGCFWCAEYIFEAVPGVDSVISGYGGGHVRNPTYDHIGKETTGNAESILIYYDPAIIKYQDVLTLFFISHNPTTPNQQGPDKGEFYRSIAFYSNEIEKQIIQDKIKQIDSSKVFENKIVTELQPLTHFFRAKDRHQNYVKNNPKDPFVISESLPRFKRFKMKY